MAKNYIIASQSNNLIFIVVTNFKVTLVLLFYLFKLYACISSNTRDFRRLKTRSKFSLILYVYYHWLPHCHYQFSRRQADEAASYLIEPLSLQRRKRAWQITQWLWGLPTGSNTLLSYHCQKQVTWLTVYERKSHRHT